MNDDIDSVEAERNRVLDGWEQASRGWGRQADRIREAGMPVSLWMIEHAELQPGQRVVELAAGPGDTGFMAAELIAPGGTLVSSDGSEAMLEVARERAAEQQIGNVEFMRLQLEWIDLPTASVDVVLCRWGVMLCLDPATALGECRRVLRPGGRMVLAVWDGPDANPWTTIPSAALISLGHLESPVLDGPGMFALSAPGMLAELLADAGFVEVELGAVAISRSYDSVTAWVGETLDCSMLFGQVWRGLPDEPRRALRAEIAARAAEFTAPNGRVTLPGRSLVALAHA